MLSAMIYFALFLIAVLFGAIHYADYLQYQVRFGIEVSVMAAVFLAGYILTERGVLGVRRLAMILFVTGVLLACFALYVTLTGAGTLRRMDMFASRNYAAAAISLSLMSGLFLYWDAGGKHRLSRWMIIGGMTVLLPSLLLLASRQAMIAFVVAVIVVYGISVDRRTLVRAMGVLVIVPAIVMALIFSRIDMSNWVRRLSSETILRDLAVRIDLWSQGFTIVDLDHFLFGRAFLYEEFGLSAYFPHNIFVSALLYGGAFVCLALMIGLGVLLAGIFFEVRRTRSRELAFVLGILIVAVSYVSFSGNITRVFNFYFVWGCAVGYFLAWRRNGRLRLEGKGRDVGAEIHAGSGAIGA
jgi:hypothetical protein